jgi:hypothetical protein
MDVRTILMNTGRGQIEIIYSLITFTKPLLMMTPFGSITTMVAVDVSYGIYAN